MIIILYFRSPDNLTERGHFTGHKLSFQSDEVSQLGLEFQCLDGLSAVFQTEMAITLGRVILIQTVPPLGLSHL